MLGVREHIWGLIQATALSGFLAIVKYTLNMKGYLANLCLTEEVKLDCLHNRLFPYS